MESTLTIAGAIEAFLKDVAAGHSPATAKTYRVGLTRFSRFLVQSGLPNPNTTPIAELNPDWAVECVRWIVAGQPTGPATQESPVGSGQRTTPRTTVATYIAGLNRFYRWCGTERLTHLPSDEYERMTSRLKHLRGKVTRTILDKVPGDDILAALMAQARQPLATLPAIEIEGEEGDAETKTAIRPNGKRAEQDARRHELIRLRNIALVETLQCTGARVSEVVGLRRGDLDATNRRARVVGKGSKERWVYFGGGAWDACQDYLRVRSRLMEEAHSLSGKPEGRAVGVKTRGATTRSRLNAGGLTAQPLFARHDRGAGWQTIKPLLPHAVEQILWELVEEAGLDTKITPHRFRHWFATRMLAATGDLATTQDLLGHASPTTTRIYAQVSESRKQDAHRSVFGS